jgi:hypothetical protein
MFSSANPVHGRLTAASSTASDTPETSAATYNFDPALLASEPAPEKTPRHPAYAQMAFLLKRMKIALCTVPFVGALLLLRWVLWMDPKNPSVSSVDAIIVAPVITCVVFVMSTVFGNVNADYKESEKIPAELVSYFQSMMIFATREARARHFDHRPMCRQLELMLLPLLSTLDGSTEASDFGRLTWDFQCAAANFLGHARDGHPDKIGHDHVELEGVEHSITEIMKKWTRIHDIGRLSIVLPAYTIMDMLCVLLSAILMCMDYKSGVIPPSSALMAISVFAFVAFYLNLMVRSLDDPFEGPDNYHYTSYCRSSTPPLTLWETWCFPTLIDFECLTVDLGRNLRKLCLTEPEALEQERRMAGQHFVRGREKVALIEAQMAI